MSLVSCDKPQEPAAEVTCSTDWFLTYTGVHFTPMTPNPDDVRIQDIAHSLSQICRFGGHTLFPYSVAQHSLLVEEIVARRMPECKAIRLQALLHDATEAYVGDCIRPIKRCLPDFQLMEARVWEAICEKFGMSKLHLKIVKWADNVALTTERRDLLVYDEASWGLEDYPPLPDYHVHQARPERVEMEFIRKFADLR